MVMRHLLYKLTDALPGRFVDHDGKPYLERYYLTTLFGKRIYIHRFVASDPDGIHDHPFRYSWSIILAGWYWEDRWGGRRKKRFFNYIGPDCFHRVVLPDNGRDVWTIFTHTARVKPWGFLRPTKPGAHGPMYEYTPESDPEDPAFSTWYKTALKGREMRKLPRAIPLGMSASCFPHPQS